MTRSACTERGGGGGGQIDKDRKVGLFLSKMLEKQDEEKEKRERERERATVKL